MESADQRKNYMSLLKIREKAGQRDMIIVGGVFIVSMLATFASGLLTALDGRSIYLVTAVDVCLGFSSLMAWVRHEIVKGSIELIDNLQRNG